MATLNTYLQQTQRFLREQRQDLENVNDLIDYVNRARREVAERTQCVRRLTPISGAVVSATVLTPGHNYTNPVCAVSAPDFPSGRPPFPSGAQASAQAIVQNGSIAAVDISFGGDGYFEPTLAIADPTGTGASVTLTTSPIWNLNSGQEVYRFADINVSMFPGVDSVFAIKSASVIYANYRYTLPFYSFSEYQAKVRSYPFQYQYVPAFGCQYGQGSDGSIYAYPIASQTYQWEFDCFCTPMDLVDNQSVDVIPRPWADVVPYFAAHLGYLELQNMNAGNYFLDLFDKMTLRKSQYARIGRAVNPYGRY